MGRLILLRHGLEENANSLHGWQDVPITDKGVGQAVRAAAFMESEKLNFKSCYTSDLMRASETARIVAEKQNGLQPVSAPELRSLNLGLLQGKPYAEIEEKFNALWSEWKNNEALRAPEGESFAEYQGRVYPFMFRMQREAANADILAVSHSHVCDYAAGVAMNGGAPLAGDKIDLMKRVCVEPGNAVEFVDGRMTRLNFIR